MAKRQAAKAARLASARRKGSLAAGPGTDSSVPLPSIRAIALNVTEAVAPPESSETKSIFFHAGDSVRVVSATPALPDTTFPRAAPEMSIIRVPFRNTPPGLPPPTLPAQPTMPAEVDLVDQVHAMIYGSVPLAVRDTLPPEPDVPPSTSAPRTATSIPHSASASPPLPPPELPSPPPINLRTASRQSVERASEYQRRVEAMFRKALSDVSANSAASVGVVPVFDDDVGAAAVAQTASPIVDHPHAACPTHGTSDYFFFCVECNNRVCARCLASDPVHRGHTFRLPPPDSTATIDDGGVTPGGGGSDDDNVDVGGATEFSAGAPAVTPLAPAFEPVDLVANASDHVLNELMKEDRSFFRALFAALSPSAAPKASPSGRK
jgi:hypothetical protein